MKAFFVVLSGITTENSDEIIVRIGESERREQKGIELSIFGGIKSAREVYASEEHIKDVEITDGKLIFDLKPYEIKTFALTVDRLPYKEPDQLDIHCPGNIVAYSNNTSRNGNLPVINKSIPWEITPEEIYVDGVKFTIPQDKKAILCGGQTLFLPKGTDRVHLLVASLNGDKVAKFGGKQIRINDIREYYAGWDLYDFKEVAFTKDGKLGYEFTHSHTENGDAKCRQLFFWNVEIDADGDTITLPVDRDILILAITANTDDNTCTLATELYDNIKGRYFDYKMNAREKLAYFNGKRVHRLNDKGGAFRDRNKGRR